MIECSNEKTKSAIIILTFFFSLASDYLEAGYEKHLGTPLGARNSQLYNERAMMLSLKHMLCVLKSAHVAPLLEFYDEIRAHFAAHYDAILQRLQSMIDRAQLKNDANEETENNNNNNNNDNNENDDDEDAVAQRTCEQCEKKEKRATKRCDECELDLCAECAAFLHKAGAALKKHKLHELRSATSAAAAATAAPRAEQSNAVQISRGFAISLNSMLPKVKAALQNFLKQ